MTTHHPSVPTRLAGAALVGLLAVPPLAAQGPECGPCVDPPAGMVAWLTFDETSGTTSADHLGVHVGLHAGLVALPVPVPGVVGGALRFEAGAFDNVVVADHPSLDFGTGDFTLDAWLRVDALPIQGTAYVVHKGLPELPALCPPLEAGFILAVETVDATAVRPVLVLSEGAAPGLATYAAGGSIPLHEWTHVAVRVDRDAAVEFFLDGAPAGGSPLSPASIAALENGHPLVVGGYACHLLTTFNGHLPGTIDELELFERALDADEIAAIAAAGPFGKCRDAAPCVQPPDDMVAWHTFDETDGAVAHDLLGTHHGAHGGAPEPTGGIVDGALLLNAPFAAERVVVPDHPELDFGLDDFTIDAWIRVDELLFPASSIVHKLRPELDGCGPFAPGYELGLLRVDADHASLFLLLSDATGVSTYVSGHLLPRGAWAHVAVRVDRDDEVRLYVDGEVRDAFPLDPADAVPLANDYPLVIGGYGCTLPLITLFFLHGAIDELELFRRALDDEEIAAVYAAGPGGKCKDDCNGNAVADSVDIAAGTSRDRYGALHPLGAGHWAVLPLPNGVPDECDCRGPRRLHGGTEGTATAPVVGGPP